MAKSDPGADWKDPVATVSFPDDAFVAPGDVERLSSQLDAMLDFKSEGSTAAAVELDALAFALVDSRGRLKRAQDRFREWVGDPSESVHCEALARRAAHGGQAVGMAPTLRHGVLAVMAVQGPMAARWNPALNVLNLQPGPADILLVVFAPSRSRALAQRSAEALGLTPLETRLVTAMLVEPSLEAAAAAVGVGRETAKDALRGATRKTGSRRAQDLVGRLIDLSSLVAHGDASGPEAVLAALGLSPMERAVAMRLADGDTADEAASRLGLKPGTVKGYRRSIFTKLGIGRARDLRRLITEAGELDRLSGADEIVSVAPTGAALRVFTDPGGRSVACLDYGPSRGVPLVLMHGYSTGRTAPPPLLAALAARGRRVIIPQRPGFGLTTPAAGIYVQTAADDMALLLDRLGAGEADILGRDGAVAAALDFAERYPERFRSGVLLNPRAPRESRWAANHPIAAVSTVLLTSPVMIERYSAIMATQTGEAIMRDMLRRAFAHVPADRIGYEAPGVAEQLVADIRQLNGRHAAGFVAEQRLFNLGWRIPEPYGGKRWRVAYSGALAPPPGLTTWNGVSEPPATVLEGAGWLAQFTHAPVLAAMFD